jgi:hypothetical protein
MLSWVRIPSELEKSSVAQRVELIRNPVISPKKMPTAIVTYFKFRVFEWQDTSAFFITMHQEEAVSASGRSCRFAGCHVSERREKA